MKTTKFFAATLAMTMGAVSFTSCNGGANADMARAEKAFSAEELKEIKAEMPTAADLDSVSYILGVNLGQMIKLQYNIASDMNGINLNEIEKGLKDAMTLERNSTPEDWDKVLDVKSARVGEIMNNYIRKRMDFTSKIELKEEEKWLAANKLNEGVVETESGLQYTMINAGGEEKVAPEDTVLVNYKGTLIDGTVFDENDSTEFAANRVIKGWTEGLALLGEGGSATLYIPSELAYGPRGNQRIAPNSTLIFNVEVLKVKKAAKK